MLERLKGKTATVLVLLSTVPAVGLASDEPSAVEEAGEAVNELIRYTRVLFDCDILIDSIELSPIQNQEMDLYWVTLNVEGVECEQALATLNDRGRSKGLYFGLARDPEAEAEYPAGTNLGGIDEVDPEVKE